MRCGCCGAMIQRKNETRGKIKAQLICSNKLAGVSDCTTGAASVTDASLLSEICAIAGAEMGLGYDKDVVIKQIDIAKSKIAEISASAAALAKAIAATSGDLPELIIEAERLQKEKAKLKDEVEEAQQKLTLEPNSLFDDTYANEVLSQLYNKSEIAKSIRAECNVRLSRVISAIWHFAYDVALVEFKNKTVMPVALGTKTMTGDRPVFRSVLSGNFDISKLSHGK